MSCTTYCFVFVHRCLETRRPRHKDKDYKLPKPTSIPRPPPKRASNETLVNHVRDTYNIVLLCFLSYAQVEIHRVQPPAQPTDHTYSTVAGRSDVVPDTIIVNKAHLLAPDDEDSFGSRCVPGPLGSTDIGVPSSVQVRVSVADEMSEATQL